MRSVDVLLGWCDVCVVRVWVWAWKIVKVRAYVTRPYAKAVMVLIVAVGASTL